MADVLGWRRRLGRRGFPRPACVRALWRRQTVGARELFGDALVLPIGPAAQTQGAPGARELSGGGPFCQPARVNLRAREPRNRRTAIRLPASQRPAGTILS